MMIRVIRKIRIGFGLKIFGKVFIECCRARPVYRSIVKINDFFRPAPVPNAKVKRRSPEIPIALNGAKIYGVCIDGSEVSGVVHTDKGILLPAIAFFEYSAGETIALTIDTSGGRLEANIYIVNDALPVFTAGSSFTHMSGVAAYAPGTNVFISKQKERFIRKGAFACYEENIVCNEKRLKDILRNLIQCRYTGILARCEVFVSLGRFCGRFYFFCFRYGLTVFMHIIEIFIEFLENVLN
jgi:hypothetical protein